MRKVITCVASAAALTAAVLAPTAHADAGTWTTITSPSGPGARIFNYVDAHASTNVTETVQVSGSVSDDVRTGPGSVDVYCTWDNDTRTSSGALNAAPLTIAGDDTFSGAIESPNSVPCTLRAIPTGAATFTNETTDDYLGAYSGPVWYAGFHQVFVNSALKTFGADALSVNRAGVDAIGTLSTSPGTPGGVLLSDPEDDFSQSGSVGWYSTNVVLGAFDQNQTVAGTPTKSEIIIDGNNAYDPAILEGMVSDHTTVPSVTVTTSRTSTGTMSWKAVEPLSRCSVDNYPQGPNSCTAVDTGVAFTRSVTTSANGAVMLIRDAFASTDGQSHSVHIEYANTIVNPGAGALGAELPGESHVSVKTPGAAYNSLPTGAHTIFVRGDVHATDNTPASFDLGVTYTAPPKVLFTTPEVWTMSYTRSLTPAHPFRLGWSVSTGFSLPTVKSLSAGAAKQLAGTLKITAPKNKASTSKKSVRVKGTVTGDANGQPAKVTVTGGAAKETASVSSSGAWSVVVPLKKGKRTLTAKATDPGGATLSASIRVTRK